MKLNPGAVEDFKSAQILPLLIVVMAVFYIVIGLPVGQVVSVFGAWLVAMEVALWLVCVQMNRRG